MTLFMSKLMSSVLELLIVSIIPFITWLIWSRKKVGFFDTPGWTTASMWNCSITLFCRS